MLRPSYLLSLIALLLIWQAAPASAAIVIKNVTIIDGTGRPEVADRYVLIDGDRIAEIRDHDIKAPADATVIDGRGKFLIPGLMDTHIHLEGGRKGENVVGGERTLTTDFDTGRRMLQGYLYHGVTSVVDVGNNPNFTFPMRDEQRSGKLMGSRLFAAGYVITRGPPGYGSGGGGPPVDTYEQGVQALDNLFLNKPDIVKFILAPHGVLGGPGPPHGTGPGPELPILDPPLLHRLIMYANEHGYRTTVHAVEGSMQRVAAEAGINSMAHPAYMTDTDDTISTLIATRGIPVSTSLSVLENIFRLVEDPNFLDSPAFRAVMTDADRAHFRDEERARYVQSKSAPWAHQAFGYAQTNVRKLYDAGVNLTTGTDRTIGPYEAEELKLIVALGIPPLQALRMGTLNGAMYLHKQDSMGSVEEGKLADLVLLNADPTKNIENVSAISTVIQAGKVIDRTKLLDLPINHRVK